MVPLDPWVVSEKLITGLSQAFEDHPYHVITEVALVVVLVYFVFAPSYAPASKTKLSEKEVDQLVDEWEPEPLYHEIDQRTKDRLDRAPVIEELRGTHALVGDRDMVNMGSFNFLGFADNDKAKQVAVETLNKYGCGTCGPRGFYGTIDKHLDVEDQIARFLGVDEAILYSSGFSTIASAIPAFAKRGDIIVCDKGISFAVQTGVNLSRSKVYWFEHNDMADLEAVLRRVADNEGKSKKLVRKFIVTEGIFANYGDICPLPDLVALKNKYKYHLCLEESFSFGVLGETGRGVTEHFGVSIDELLFTCASVGNACASVGGFCAGSHRVIDHQRLSGVGYVFSASSPTLLVTFAGAVLQMLDDDPSVLKTLTDNTGRLFNRLNSIGAFEVSGDKASPVMHVTLAAEGAEREEEEDVLDAVVDAVAAAGYLVVRSAYVEREEAWIPRPSIRVTVSAGHTRAEIDGLADALADAAADL